MTNNDQTLYDILGEDFFVRLVGGFYDRVKKDGLIGPMYPEDDLDGAEERLRWFLVQYWGGPHTFNEKRGRPMLRKRHFRFHIGQAEAERWLDLMEDNLNQFSTEELSAEHREMLWNHMQRVAYMMINA